MTTMQSGLAQSDLFGHPAIETPRPSEEVAAVVRARLHATLILVQGAAAMPWADMLSVIREDNAFRFGKDVLPAAEGEALWRAFDVEMDRLYAIMNAGKDFHPGDR